MEQKESTEHNQSSIKEQSELEKYKKNLHSNDFLHSMEYKCFLEYFNIYFVYFFPQIW